MEYYGEKVVSNERFEKKEDTKTGWVILFGSNSKSIFFNTSEFKIQNYFEKIAYQCLLIYQSLSNNIFNLQQITTKIDSVLLNFIG